MFSRIFAVAAFAALAIAGPLEVRGGSTQCDTGALSCCNQVQSVQSLFDNAGFIGADIPVSALVGVSCTPVTVLGTGSGAQCSTQPVCCTSNNMYGTANMGCMPVNVNA
ncbi:hydrophobin-3 precursor [Pisolithus orientalis]|uniref:hydrophobin-3 precursor n=1 Tax=Pisolithus orientalis TaxID=936130 RepID=UPI00222431E8|nr:hydrophobin-3 precursor [Pisolithus orientalis]KAI5997244.1 hydrophobin-3 precursor [Pisolithus orientalis]